ncbi:MAG: hypothetical protein V1874_15620 [Spirochaetota bacterium]
MHTQPSARKSKDIHSRTDARVQHRLQRASSSTRILNSTRVRARGAQETHERAGV